MTPRTSIILLVLSSIVSFVAAYIGFGGVEEDYSIASRAYMALQLFTFQGGDVEGSVPFGVEIARWLAPATTLGGVYAAAHAFFLKLWGNLRLRWVRGHTVICGGGAKGSALAAELAESADTKVVLIDPAESAELEALRRQGVLVCIGDGGNASIMQQVGLYRASRLVCITGDDRTNIGMALAAAESLPQERVNEPLDIFVHVGEVARRNILQRSQMLDLKHDPRHRIRLFNCHANRARLAFEEYPLEWDARTGLRDDVHLVVGALGPLEKAMVVHAAHIGHFRNGGRVRVHLVSVRANADEAALLKEYPGLRKCAELESHPIAEADDFVDAVAEAASAWSKDSLITVLPGGSAEAALAEALLLGERLKSGHDPDDDGEGGPILRVLLDAPADSGIRAMVVKNPKLASWIRFLPDLVAAVGKDAVFQESLDRVARKIHETWKSQTDEKIRVAEANGETEVVKKHRKKETYRDWDDLTEEQKDGNRLAADHIPVKFRTVGLDPKDGHAVREAWPKLNDQELDLLSRMEHERWAAPLWMSGWKQGSNDNGETDNLRRLHPNLVPYDELDQETKNYDIKQVRSAAQYRLD
jgi:hypothetical protein